MGAPRAHTSLALAPARAALARGRERADALGIAVSLAVDKAYTAVAHRCPTAELAPLAAPGGELFGLHASGGGRYVLFAGGLPVVRDGVVVGGVGVSGGSADEDAECAAAMVG